MRSFTIIVAVAATLGCTACVSHPIDRAHVELRPGMTEPQVVARLGRPNARVAIGRRAMLMWVHEVHSLFRPKARSFTAVFDEQGRMVEPAAARPGAP